MMINKESEKSATKDVMLQHGYHGEEEVCDYVSLSEFRTEPEYNLKGWQGSDTWG
jgi:hypothetical protein